MRATVKMLRVSLTGRAEIRVAIAAVLVPVWAVGSDALDLEDAGSIAALHHELHSTEAHEREKRVELLVKLHRAYRWQRDYENGERYCREALAEGQGLPRSDVALQAARQALAGYLTEKAASRESERFFTEQLHEEGTSSGSHGRATWVDRFVGYYTSHDDHTSALRLLEDEIEREGGTECRDEDTCENAGRYLELAGDVFLQQGDPDRAVTMYTGAVRSLSRSYPSLYLTQAQLSLARGLRAAGRLEAAEAAYRTVIETWKQFIADESNDIDPSVVLPDLIDELADLLESTGQEGVSSPLRARSESLRRPPE